jgi:hypothetical protein
MAVATALAAAAAVNCGGSRTLMCQQQQDMQVVSQHASQTADRSCRGSISICFWICEVLSCVLEWGCKCV